MNLVNLKVTILANPYLNPQSLSKDLTAMRRANLDFFLLSNVVKNTTFIEIAVLIFTLHDLENVELFVQFFF